MRYDIILTTFNRLEYTKRTLASLIETGAIASAERVIIVDNRSTEPGFQEFLNDLYNFNGNLFVVRRAKNDGWGTAVNDAIGLSRAPYLLLSNNDVVYKPGFIDRMAETFEKHPDVGLLGVWRHTSHGYVAPENGGLHSEHFREMDNIPAVGWLLSKPAMMKVGMLNEHGPCFTKGGNGEDTAYVNRMKEAGFRTGVMPEDVAEHIDGY